MRQIITLFMTCFFLLGTQSVRAQNATEDILMNLAIHGSLWTFVGSTIWGKNPLTEGLHLKSQWGWGYQQGADHTTQLSQAQIIRPFKNTLYQGNQWDLTAHWEFDAGYWHSTQRHPKNSDGYFFGITPVFNYTWRCAGIQPYLEFGAGAKYLNNITIENNYKSTQFQFGDILGFGMGSAHFQVGYRYLHISNANIALPNPGTNFQTVQIQYLF